MKQQPLKIQKPEDIEKYDFIEPAQSIGFVSEEQPKKYIQNNINLYQLQQSLYTISMNLTDFETILEKLGNGLEPLPIQFDDQANLKRRSEQLRKSVACKIKTLKEISHQYTQAVRIPSQYEAQERLRASIKTRKKYYNFASNSQIQLYCRNCALPSVNKPIYANFYHDLFVGLCQFYYPVIVKNDNGIDIYRQLTDKVLIIVVDIPQNKNKIISFASQQIELYEQILYSYLSNKKTQKIEFQYVNNQIWEEYIEKYKSYSILYIQMVYELIIKRGCIENYYQYVEKFIQEL